MFCWAVFHCFRRRSHCQKAWTRCCQLRLLTRLSFPSMTFPLCIRPLYTGIIGCNLEQTYGPRWSLWNGWFLKPHGLFPWRGCHFIWHSIRLSFHLVWAVAVLSHIEQLLPYASQKSLFTLKLWASALEFTVACTVTLSVVPSHVCLSACWYFFLFWPDESGFCLADCTGCMQ